MYYTLYCFSGRFLKNICSLPILKNCYSFYLAACLLFVWLSLFLSFLCSAVLLFLYSSISLLLWTICLCFLYRSYLGSRGLATLAPPPHASLVVTFIWIFSFKKSSFFVVRPLTTPTLSGPTSKKKFCGFLNPIENIGHNLDKNDFPYE